MILRRNFDKGSSNPSELPSVLRDLAIIILVVMVSWWSAIEIARPGDRLRFYLTSTSDLRSGARLGRDDFEITLGLLKSEKLPQYLNTVSQAVDRVAKVEIKHGDPLSFASLEKAIPTGIQDDPGEELACPDRLSPCDLRAAVDRLRSAGPSELGKQLANLTATLNERFRDHSAQLDSIKDAIEDIPAGTETARSITIDLEQTGGKLDLVRMFYDLFVTLGAEPLVETGKDLMDIAKNSANAFLESVASTSGDRLANFIFDSVLPVRREEPSDEQRGWDNVGPVPDPVAPRVSIENFELNKVSLPSGASKQLEPVFRFAQLRDDCKVVVRGHTDKSGNADYNLWLSQQRAEEAKRTLEKRISPARVQVWPVGEMEPAEHTDDGIVNAKNRRVELVFHCPKLANQ